MSTPKRTNASACQDPGSIRSARAAAFARRELGGDYPPWDRLAASQRPEPRRSPYHDAEPAAGDIRAIDADVDSTGELIAAQLRAAQALASSIRSRVPRCPGHRPRTCCSSAYDGTTRRTCTSGIWQLPGSTDRQGQPNRSVHAFRGTPAAACMALTPARRCYGPELPGAAGGVVDASPSRACSRARAAASTRCSLWRTEAHSQEALPWLTAAAETSTKKRKTPSRPGRTPSARARRPEPRRWLATLGEPVCRWSARPRRPPCGLSAFLPVFCRCSALAGSGRPG
jgi:hypothetical protein